MTAAPKRGLTETDFAEIDALLGPADEDRLRAYPGDRTDRQPVHTVYVPADRMRSDLTARWSAAAAAALDAHAPGPGALAEATGLDGPALAEVWDAVSAKLAREPIEDLRIDLEDGYGTRPDADEDRDAVSAAEALIEAVAVGQAPPFVGIRFKSLEGGTRRRGLRSLDLVLGTLLDAGPLPPGWVVTLPKVTSVAQVSAMVDVCRRLERAYGLADRDLKFEIQIETPQAILLADGTAGVAAMLHAADGRCTGLHFGTYDYTAALGISGGYQAMDHPAADHAKAVMQLAAAGTGVRLSDGSTNIVPVGDTSAVHAAWALHARLVRRSLERGLYQGWDLHPAQLPTRFVATYLFFRNDLDRICARLQAYLGGGEGGVMDEPATAQALAAFLSRGVHCGAVSADEVTTLTGASPATIATLAGRRVS